VDIIPTFKSLILKVKDSISHAYESFLALSILSQIVITTESSGEVEDVWEFCFGKETFLAHSEFLIRLQSNEELEALLVEFIELAFTHLIKEIVKHGATPFFSTLLFLMLRTKWQIGTKVRNTVKMYSHPQYAPFFTEAWSDFLNEVELLFSFFVFITIRQMRMKMRQTNQF